MVERTGIGHQARSLVFEHRPGGPLPDLGMGMGLGPGDATVLEPGVEFGVALDLWPRHEEPPSDHAHLVLDLPLLPARRRGAGDRLEQVVPGHLKEPATFGPRLADEDRVHRGLHVVVDPSGARATEEGERLVVGVEHRAIGSVIGPSDNGEAPASPADRRGQTPSGCGRAGHA